jgi:hypothetical protein
VATLSDSISSIFMAGGVCLHRKEPGNRIADIVSCYQGQSIALRRGLLPGCWMLHT